MAQEGLFFTGTVLKNNRNLLEEEAARQQLAMQREQLELQKQAAADKRKEARKKNETKPGSYSLDGMDPFYAEQFQGSVSEYQSFVTDNSMDFDDNPELKNQKLKNEGDLSVQGSRYKSISSDLTSYRNLIKNGNGDKLALAEDGSYLFEYNLNKQKEAVNSGDMTINEAIETYPTDAQSMVNKSEFIPFYMVDDDYFEKDDQNREGKFEGTDGYNYLSISDDQKSQTKTKIVSKLKVNLNNNHNDSNAAAIYNNEQFTIDGESMSAKEAFFLQAYENEDGEVEKITAPSQELMDQLDPQSENFNKELSDQYAEYLGQKIADREYENRGAKRSSKISADSIAEKKKKEQEEAQLQYNIDTYNDIRTTETSDTRNAGYETYIDSQNKNLVKNISSKGLGLKDLSYSDILGDSEIETEGLKATGGSTGAPVEIHAITLDSGGNVVVLVKHFSGAHGFIPYEILPVKQIEALGEEVKNLTQYRKPQVKFDPNNY